MSWRALLLAGLIGFVGSAAATEMPATGSVEVVFSPWDDVEGKLIATLGEAKQTIHVQAYLLTSRSITKALLDAHQRGVKVRLLADAEMVKNGDNTQIPKLAEAGIPVWLETRYVNAHNKTILIDAEGQHPIVITGSYNYTWSAQARNAENLIVLRDNSALAAQYLHNWQRHQRDAQAYTSGI
ncbi:MAG TPA: phospholipase D family protein [Rhodocyclaceae bacterium]|jgi:phosphatidylserine/phosphatidylglycerophosphate/cardiolipin synthase-like enzyme|nr:phospholipase D family protein [Rhodocyclaceae bacterium]